MILRQTLRRLYRSIVPRTHTSGGGHTDSARYCYCVWMRHMVNLHRLVGPFDMDAVAELGPGKSLGTGLAAMLSGTKRLYAFDLLEYTGLAANVPILDELADLYRRAEPIPDANEFPRVLPLLPAYDFPRGILTSAVLSGTLSDDRLGEIRGVLLSGARRPSIDVRYIAPWDEREPGPGESVDVLFSQAVMLYVSDLDRSYRAMARWLKPGGLMSHTINFTSCGFARGWDGHWAYSEQEWLRVLGQQPYRISRLPFSAHVRAIKNAGFELIDADREIAAPTLKPERYDAGFASLTDEDRETSRAVLVARKL